MPRILARLFLGVCILAIGGLVAFAFLEPETKNRILIRGVGALERLLRPIEFKKAYQPFFKRVSLLAQRGFGSGRDDMEASGEAAAVRFYREIVLRARPERIVLFDVGAFEGEYTDLLVSTFTPHPKIDVHAFEPATRAFEVLSARLAKDSRVHLVKAALGHEQATLSLHVDPSPKMNSLVARPHLRGALETENVPVLTLDDYCARNAIPRIDILKLDVEGYELNVLKGAARMLAQNITVIQFEYGSFSLTNRVLFHDLFAILSDGYQVFRIVGDGLEPILEGNAVWEQNSMGGNYVAILKTASF